MYLFYLVIAILVGIGSPYAFPEYQIDTSKRSVERMEESELAAQAKLAAYYIRAIPRTREYVAMSGSSKKERQTLDSAGPAVLSVSINGINPPNPNLVRFRFESDGELMAELVGNDITEADRLRFRRLVYSAMRREYQAPKTYMEDGDGSADGANSSSL